MPAINKARSKYWRSIEPDHNSPQLLHPVFAGHVYRCALFIYATEGIAPGPFDNDQMNLGWKRKKEKK